MPERINKLQPDRTLSLRGFNTFAAAATIHSASPTGFTVSGTFRDPADFTVAVLYDADNVFEHPSIRYLPDFDFSGLILNFDLTYSAGLQPIDSPKFNWIDWATLDFILENGNPAEVNLFQNAMLVGTSFPAATATVNVTTSGTVEGFDDISLWYQSKAFEYSPGTYPSSATFAFTGTGVVGTVHSITVNGVTYPYSEVSGDTNTSVAAGVAGAVSDPYVSASSSGNIVTLTINLSAAGTNITVSASDANPGPLTIFLSTPEIAAAAIVSQINSFDWVGFGATHSLLASVSGAAITLAAGQYGTVSVTGDGTAVTWLSGTYFGGITPGSTILLAGAPYTVASITSPTALTLHAPAPLSSSQQYVAPRGGWDGNLIQLYTLSRTSTLAFDQSQITLSGGDSTVTWNVTIDFSTVGVAPNQGQLRQCWLTFAPALVNSATYTATEWQAVFSNWTVTGPSATQALQIAGPGSVRIEDDDIACIYTGSWPIESGDYSKYFAHAAYFSGATSDTPATLTVNYTCQFTHNLYVGTSLYIDRGSVEVTLDGIVVANSPLNCYLAVSDAVVTRRLLSTAVAPGRHTVTFTMAAAGYFYFDFLEAAVLSDVPDALIPRPKISPALDFDTNATYMMTPARLMWMLNKLGYAGPINEYLGVFWWNQRTQLGGSVSTAQVTFGGTYADNDQLTVTLNAVAMNKTVLPADTLSTIAQHFADYINGSFVGAWASASGAALTIYGRSPSVDYTLTVAVSTTSTAGTVAVTTAPVAGVYGTWVIDDTISPPINHGTRDWHADLYSLVAAAGLEIVTSLSMELVNPPSGYAALFPDGTAVSTDTGFASLFSTQCAVGSSQMLAYQQNVYLNIAQMQQAAGLMPSLQFGEFLWWYFADASGMAFYDSETTAAASTALGRALHVFLTPNDDPTVNSSSDATFLRDRLRDHVATLIAAVQAVYPTTQFELLWPYDVNYPTPLPGGLGGQLNRLVNLPVEWQTPATCSLTTIKTEALQFGATMRNLDLAREAIALFPGFGWPASSVRYLVPVFGIATPWQRELALVWAANLPAANLWALDHICLFNLTVPEPGLERRSFSA